MLWSIRDLPRLIDKKIIRGFSLSAVRECSRQTAKSTRRKSNRIHQQHHNGLFLKRLIPSGFTTKTTTSAPSYPAMPSNLTVNTHNPP